MQLSKTAEIIMKNESSELTDMLTKMAAMSVYQDTLPSVKTTYSADESRAEIPLPVLHHAELRELFICGNNLPQEIRAHILVLPADTLAADLCALMQYAVADFERIKKDPLSGESWLLTHAYFLGGAVQDNSMPYCLLNALSQPEEIIEFYLGDLLTEGAASTNTCLKH